MLVRDVKGGGRRGGGGDVHRQFDERFTKQGAAHMRVQSADMKQQPHHTLTQ